MQLKHRSVVLGRHIARKPGSKWFMFFCSSRETCSNADECLNDDCYYILGTFAYSEFIPGQLLPSFI